MQTAAWERRLHTRALAAFNSDRRDKASITDCSAIRAAYAYCAEVTQKHSRTFYLASGLLPPEKRRAARALYAFCRVTDDLVDRAQNYNYRHMTLERWRERVMSPDLHASDPVALAWVDTQVRYSIPRGYVQQLIDGVSRDLTQTRYATFDDLAEYCYGVASTVGLMVMHIVGFEGEEAVPYAVKLGVALQLTNIFRDVSEDYRAGRLYLPQEELAAYGIAEADIANGNLTCNWREFMHFQIERARRPVRRGAARHRHA